MDRFYTILQYSHYLIFLLGGIQTGWAQQPIIWEAYGHVGALTSHKQDRAVAEHPLWGAELTLSRQATGKKLWQLAHGLPQMGLTLRARNIGNASVYGYDLAVVPFLEFNVWRTKSTTLQVKHGTGLSYLSKQYEPVQNPTNQLISTRFNAISLLNIGLLVRGNAHLDLKMGVELSHESNSNLRQPNAGLNTVALYSGIRYYPNKKLTGIAPVSVNRCRREWRGYVGTAFGLYGQESSGLLTAVPQAEALLLFQHDIRFRAAGGFELLFPNGEPDQLAVKIGEEVLFGHLGIRYQIGTYLFDRGNNGPVFEKIGLAYYPLPLVNHVARTFCVGTSLKAHGLRAAFVELNAGYVF